MALVLAVGGLVGWYVREVRIRREALAVIAASGGRVSFRDQQPDAAGWSVLLYRTTGDELFRTVSAVSLRPSPAAVVPAAKPEPSSDLACAAIARLGRVERVDVLGEPLTATGLGHLASAQVDQLGLYGLQCDAAMLAQVRRMHHLKGLTISDPGSPREVIAAVAALTQLEEVSLIGLAGVRSQDLTPLGTLNGLKKIRIDAAPLDEAALDHLGALGELTDLAFAKTCVTDAGLRRLVARAPRLRRLAVDGSLLTDRGIAALGAWRDLESLSLLTASTKPRRLTDASLVALGRIRSLKLLFVTSGCFTDVGLDALRGLPLDRLILDSLAATEEGVGRLLEGRTFAYLGLHGPGVTDAVLPRLAGHLAATGTLDLSRSKVSDVGMSHLAALKLRGLLLNGTALTDTGLATLTTGATLRLLMANDTPVTPAGAAAFQAARPGTRLYTGAAD